MDELVVVTRDPHRHIPIINLLNWNIKYELLFYGIISDYIDYNRGIIFVTLFIIVFFYRRGGEESVKKNKKR